MYTVVDETKEEERKAQFAKEFGLALCVVDSEVIEKQQKSSGKSLLTCLYCVFSWRSASSSESSPLWGRLRVNSGENMARGMLSTEIRFSSCTSGAP